jgi:Serine-pyruvate aminotransferase/archaeal aspartate aminotransferase
MNGTLMMTPGPTYITEEVRRAMGRPITNPDLDPEFFEFYKKTAVKTAKLIRTKNDVLILGGEGILGLETACASLTEPGDRVLCIDNGIFGKGFGDFVKIYGGDVTFFKCDYRKPVPVEELKKFLESDHDFKFATVVHCETPSGLLNPVDKICPLLKKYNILTIVDAVSSIGGVEVNVDDWQIDIAIGGSQKCISAPPGLAFMSISNSAWENVLKRKTPIGSFYCNLAVWKNWYSEKWFPYTQPISDLYAFDCAVENLLDDNNKYKRHAAIGKAVRAAITEGGFELYPADGYSNTVTVFVTPRGLDEQSFRKRLLEEYDVLIAGAFDVLSGKVLRIGHMGENCHEDKLHRTLRAMDSCFREFGVNPKVYLHKAFDGALSGK